MSYGKITLIALLPVIIALGCEPEGGQAKNTDRDDSDDWGDTDTDTDIDTDTDSDSDTDMDSDSDGEGKDDNGCDKMDILFVIDNSGSMIEEQNNLIQNFPQFIQVLEDYRTPAGTQLTYRVGVIDTSKKVTVNMKMPGFPTPIPEPMPGSSGALKTVQGSGQKWIEGPGADVSSQFSNIARVGTNGSGFEMPLEVARLAFSEGKKTAQMQGSGTKTERPCQSWSLSRTKMTVRTWKTLSSAACSRRTAALTRTRTRWRIITTSSTTCTRERNAGQP